MIYIYPISDFTGKLPQHQRQHQQPSFGPHLAGYFELTPANSYVSSARSAWLDPHLRIGLVFHSLGFLTFGTCFWPDSLTLVSFETHCWRFMMHILTFRMHIHASHLHRSLLHHLMTPLVIFRHISTPTATLFHPPLQPVTQTCSDSNGTWQLTHQPIQTHYTCHVTTPVRMSPFTTA